MRAKIASDLSGVLQQTAAHMVKLADSHAELLNLCAQQEHELKAMKLARRLEQRGLSHELSFEEKVAQLLQTPVEKLATMEQAIELASGGFRLGTVPAEERSAGDNGNSPDVLDTFIASQAAYQ